MVLEDKNLLKKSVDDLTLDENNLWTSILSNVYMHNNKKLPVDKNVIVLGDNETGKTSLIAKLQGVEDPKKGWGLEYSYIVVRDEYRDDYTRLGVWILDGHENYSCLLNYALNEKTFSNTLVMITVSMTEPWSILDQLGKWTKILNEHISKLNIEPEKMEQFKQRIVNNWCNYIEPSDDLTVISPMKRPSMLFGDVDVNTIEPMSLSDQVLINNLGLDIIVIVTKTDYISALEKDYYFKDEMLDFMQQWIRRFCLEYGAALFYMSAKEDKNCDILYKYLIHRIYGFSFKTPALVVEKDAIFIPMGWDSMKKISILYENIHLCHPDDPYNSVIALPFKQTSVNETEVIAEDEQEFLSQRLKILQAAKEKIAAESSDDATNIDSNITPMRSMNIKTSPRINNAPIYQSTPKAADMAKNTSGSNENNLIEFFNSLLTKKVGLSKPPTSGSISGNSSDKVSDKRVTLMKSETSDA